MASDAGPRPAVRAAQALVPLALAAALAVYVLAPGPGLEPPGLVVLPEITIEQVEFADGEIRASVRNTGHVDVSIAQADVNDRIQPSAAEPGSRLGRLAQATVRIPYEWNAGEPYEIGITLDDGTRFARAVEAAVPAITADAQTLSYLVAVGACVGVVPVAIGLAWRPAIARLRSGARAAVLAFAMGLLAFVAADTMRESLEVSAEWGLDSAYNGTLMAVTAAALVFLAMQWASAAMRRAGAQAPVAIAILVAAGIGMHNLGEGLAIGAAAALGQAAFASTLVVGLALHNVTEGLAIAAPVARSRVGLAGLAGLAALAGLPVMAGTAAGALAFSPAAAAVLLAAAAGAVVQVIASMASWMRSEGISLSGAPVLAGAGAGMATLYAVSVLA